MFHPASEKKLKLNPHDYRVTIGENSISCFSRPRLLLLSRLLLVESVESWLRLLQPPLCCFNVWNHHVRWIKMPMFAPQIMDFCWTKISVFVEQKSLKSLKKHRIFLGWIPCFDDLIPHDLPGLVNVYKKRTGKIHHFQLVKSTISTGSWLQ